MDNFKIMYRVLKYLEASLDYTETDAEGLSPEALGISGPRRDAIVAMLYDAGYIADVNVTRYIDCRGITVTGLNRARITLKGLEYLQENGIMKKLAAVAKGVAEIMG